MNAIKERFIRYIFLFLFFCIIGWVYEVVLAFIYGYGFVNRGFMFGPYLPLYGFGAVLLILCLEKLMQNKIRIGRVTVTPIIVFVMIILITTALEYFVGLLLEAILHTRFWDYSTYKYQLHGRICLSASIRFGIGGMIFLYLLFPLFSKLIEKIPAKQRFIISIAIILILLADFAFTIYWSSHYGFNPVLAQPK